ncbi:hypothetical protein BSL78_04592 [Apostichopus japonicus]|uniref:Uncharacterized protein n=1 Tax=Stichopus japonicus TaxID=307972 RepID=A0A2G8LE36_STIJA|nr:hypothetical protein BSL78_04592 [Apostichopus japonicus]
MGHFGRGQVGIGDDLTRVQDRVHLRPALRGGGKTYSNTHRPRPTSSTRRGSISLAGEAGNCRGVGRGGTPLPLLPVSNTKTGRVLAPDLEPKTPQQKLRRTKTFPYGDPKFNPTPAQKGHVGGKRRPTGRLLTYTNTSTSPAVPSLPIRRKEIYIQVTPVRPVYGTKSLHKSGRNGNRLPQETRSNAVRLPRRLAHSRRVEVQRGTQRTENGADPSGTGLDNQSNKIPANTNTDDPVPGGQTRPHHRHSQSLRTKDRGSQSGHSPDHIVTRVTHRNVAPSPGANVQPGRRGDIMQTTHASAATPPAENGQPTNPGPDSADPPIGRHSPPIYNGGTTQAIGTKGSPSPPVCQTHRSRRTPH